MEDTTYLTILYDYYGGLLNKKEQLYFEEYYFNNLSLSEMSEQLGISRNAIHKHLKKIENTLQVYETILKLYKKEQELKQIIDEVKDNKLKEKLMNIIND